jgi:hypothetical protein
MHILSHARLDRSPLCNIAEELRCHTLSFLSYYDIICCALVSPPLPVILGVSSTNTLVSRFKDLPNDVQDGQKLY